MKILFKPLTMALGMVGGLVAGAIFKQVWKRIDNEEDPPTPLQKEFGWTKILLAAALQGAIYGTVKAAVSRGGAKGVEKATGAWVGEKDDRRAEAAPIKRRARPWRQRPRAAHCATPERRLAPPRR